MLKVFMQKHPLPYSIFVVIGGLLGVIGLDIMLLLTGEKELFEAFKPIVTILAVTWIACNYLKIRKYF